MAYSRYVETCAYIGGSAFSSEYGAHSCWPTNMDVPVPKLEEGDTLHFVSKGMSELQKSATLVVAWTWRIERDSPFPEPKGES